MWGRAPAAPLKVRKLRFRRKKEKYDQGINCRQADTQLP